MLIDFEEWKNLEKQHKEKYGVEPNVIGAYWNDQEEQLRLLKKAIKGTEPYDEYLMLSKEDREAWDEGQLFF